MLLPTAVLAPAIHRPRSFSSVCLRPYPLHVRCPSQPGFSSHHLQCPFRQPFDILVRSQGGILTCTGHQRSLIEAGRLNAAFVDDLVVTLIPDLILAFVFAKHWNNVSHWPG